MGERTCPRPHMVPSQPQGSRSSRWDELDTPALPPQSLVHTHHTRQVRTFLKPESPRSPGGSSTFFIAGTSERRLTGAGLRRRGCALRTWPRRTARPPSRGRRSWLPDSATGLLSGRVRVKRRPRSGVPGSLLWGPPAGRVPPMPPEALAAADRPSVSL